VTAVIVGSRVTYDENGHELHLLLLWINFLVSDDPARQFTTVRRRSVLPTLCASFGCACWSAELGSFAFARRSGAH